MKKNFLYLMMAFALVMPFTACDDDDNALDSVAQHDPESDEDQTAVTAYDALDWLQNSIVVVGENDTIARRVYGEMLDPSDTTILSVAVADYAMAETVFLNWVAPMKEQNLEKVEDGYIYSLTDASGNSQGSVEFRQADSSEGILAKMTVDEGTALKAVSEVRFISKDAWPENAAQAKLYKKGEIYRISAPFIKSKKVPTKSSINEDYSSQATRGKFGPGLSVPDSKIVLTVTYQVLEFYCIQGNDNGQEAILIYLSPDVDDTYAHAVPKVYVDNNATKYFAAVPEAQKVLDYYTNNYDEWCQMIQTMEARGHRWDWHYGISTTGNAEFLLNGYDAANGTVKCLDLDEKVGKICDVSLNSFWRFRYRHILVRTAPAYMGE